VLLEQEDERLTRLLVGDSECDEAMRSFTVRWGTLLARSLAPGRSLPPATPGRREPSAPARRPIDAGSPGRW